MASRIFGYVDVRLGVGSASHHIHWMKVDETHQFDIMAIIRAASTAITYEEAVNTWDKLDPALRDTVGARYV